MKKTTLNKAHQLITLFTILAVFQLVVNNALFIHTHYMANGQIITHSHPYNKQDKESNPQHNHTKSAYAALDNLARVAAIFSADIYFCSSYFKQSYIQTSHQFHFDAVNTETDDRAPPTFS